MAGRNHSDHRHIDDSVDFRLRRRLSPTELRLIEDRIAAQSREIQTLLLDNQRLASSYVALKQDVVSAQKDVRDLSSTASAVKAERDAQVREVYERSLKLEAETQPMEVLFAELDRAQIEIKELRSEREQLSEKLTGIEEEIARNYPELKEFSEIKNDIETMQREIRKGRAAVEYERKIQSTNFEISKEMKKHLISMAREAEMLRLELANAGKVDLGAAAYPGHGYAIHHPTLEPGFGEN